MCCTVQSLSAAQGLAAAGCKRSEDVYTEEHHKAQLSTNEGLEPGAEVMATVRQAPSHAAGEELAAVDARSVTGENSISCLPQTAEGAPLDAPAGLTPDSADFELGKGRWRGIWQDCSSMYCQATPWRSLSCQACLHC